MYCTCGTVIYVVSPGLYYAKPKVEPIAICPTCGKTLEADKLQDSILGGLTIRQRRFILWETARLLEEEQRRGAVLSPDEQEIMEIGLRLGRGLDEDVK
jgi:hypothetical protein